MVQWISAIDTQHRPQDDNDARALYDAALSLTHTSSQAKRTDEQQQRERARARSTPRDVVGTSAAHNTQHTQDDITRSTTHCARATASVRGDFTHNEQSVLK